MTKSTHPRNRMGQLSRWRRWEIYVVGSLGWATGALWLLYHYFVRVEDKLGFEAPHPLEHWWLVLHAAASFCAIWIFGVLWPIHVKRSWKAKIRRLTGGALFGVTTWLTLTGFALYYIGSDTWRSLTSISHWAVGLAALAVFLWHLLTRAAHHPH